MRGIKAVLYVAVLVCLISSSFAATCNKGKASDDGNGCVCKSGYGTTANDRCLTLVNNGACVGATLSKTEANHFPSLAETSTFVSNTLNARIEAEFVPKRQYEEIKFTPLAGQPVEPKCNLGNTGSFWTQNPHFISGVSCNDSFVLAMPWASHGACGFANNTKFSNSEEMFITGYLHIKYTDDLDEVENFTLTRSTKVPYSITVKFQKHVTVKLLALNVSSDVKFGMALTEDVYDPVSQILTLELTTIVNWPNMFFTGKEKTKIFLPDQVFMLDVDAVNGKLCTDPLADCLPTGHDSRDTFPRVKDNTCDPQTQDSICKQSFTWAAKIKPLAPVKNCTFDGEYNLQIGLYTCRGVGGPSLEPDCTNQLVNITYTIQDSFVCGEIGVTPSVDGHLYAFDPAYTGGFRALVTAHKDIQQFKLGTYGHFYAQIDSDDNLISLNFTNIRFKTQEIGAAWTNLYDLTAGTHSQYLQIFDNSKYFRVYFHSSTFKVNPNSQVVYTFSATCEIAFEGNPGYVASPESKKRTVEYSWTQASAQAMTNVFMSPESSALDTKEETQTPAGVSSVTFIASVVGAVAGTMIIVFVVVGLALRARSSKEQEVSSSLVAASSAAAEIANRA